LSEGVKRNRNILFGILIAHATAAFLMAQAKLEPDAPGCIDSRTLPKLSMCRIDNCETKNLDQRDASVREDEKGQVITAALDGSSRSIMYECREGTTPGEIVQQATAALKASAFPVLYQFVGQEGAVTARKGDLWLLIEAAARYYTLVELKAIPPDFESLTDASEFADAIERYGHVSIYGIHFAAGRADFAADSEAALKEISAMMEAHPDWRFRIESHTPNTGTKMGNMTLTAKRASALLNALTGRGIKRLRLESTGLGDTHPVADNLTPQNRAKNERIELVKITEQN
jgi:outer membrane protein OmpA-like peptidoglycan-associated protein